MFAKVLDQAAFSYKRHTPAFTDFLDMAKSGKFLEKLRSLSDLNVVAFGGTEDCERRMLGFAPDYMELEGKDFPICALRITKHKKFGQTDLSHRDYLGSIMGLGIERSLIGDIILKDGGAFVFVMQRMAAYLCEQLTAVRKTPVTCSLWEHDGAFPEPELEPMEGTVSSVRLDAVTAFCGRMSRSKAAAFIEGEKVSVNGQICTSVSRNVKEGEVLSLRGIGKFRFEQSGAPTKKGRLPLLILRYK